ncbi:MAG: hypothetical protein N3F66_09040 [Spirochaetes bacterium]|nr:hypothetical protein [Spirochaetota bacterium]
MRHFFILFILFLIISPTDGFSDQLTADRAIQENKEFIEFMDVPISNFGDKYKEEFKDIYQIHFNAEVAYLQSDYNRAFRNVYESQKKQADLYSKLVREYLDETKKYLDAISPEVIKSKNKKARLYLNLAYRDREVARTHHTVADASNPRLCSNKIYKYIEAIKVLRRARRYGFLAIFESQTDETKKKIYNHLFEIEREKGNLFYVRFISKTEQEIIDEMQKEYYEVQLPGITGQPQKQEETYEKRIEKRARFRDERRVAEYLLTAEFEKAEPIIRDYVKDFNFNLIVAAIEFLVVNKSPVTANFTVEQLKRYHDDNYSRYYSPSTLNTFAGEMKVIDAIEKKPEGEASEEKLTTESKPK